MYEFDTTCIFFQINKTHLILESYIFIRIKCTQEDPKSVTKKYVSYLNLIYFDNCLESSSLASLCYTTNSTIYKLFVRLIAFLNKLKFLYKNFIDRLKLKIQHCLFIL